MMVLNANTLKDARITLTLIFLNVFIFINFTFILPWEDTLLFVQINRNIIYDHEIWRLFTSMFLHVDISHIFSNMIGLLLFGASLENNPNVPKWEFLMIYFLSGLIGNLFSLLLLPLDIISLGASGAIFGLIGAVFVLVATEDRSLLLFASLYLVVFIITSLAPGINLWAHLFGLLVGMLFGYFIYMRRRRITLVY